ncbi:MAG: SBBP repeat-containing protein [Armatimonadota bacterium]
MAVDDAGNVYVTGSEPYSSIVVTASYAPAGTERWVRRYDAGNGPNYSGVAVFVTPNGSVYVAASSEEWPGGDYIALKYAAVDGAEEWVRRFPAQGNARAAALDQEGNLSIIGWSRARSEQQDLLTVSFGPDGAERWARWYTAAEATTEYPVGIAVDDHGGVYVAGTSATDPVTSDYVTVAYSTDGSERWVRHYDGPGDSRDSARDIAIDGAQLYVTGDSWPALELQSAATVCYGLDGTELWVRRYSNEERRVSYVSAVEPNGRGQVYVVGTCWTSSTTLLLMLVYGPDGTLLDERVFPQFQGIHTATTDAAGNLYVLGADPRDWTGCQTASFSVEDGALRWSRRYFSQKDQSPVARAFAIDSAGNVFVAVQELGPMLIKYSHRPSDTLAPQLEPRWGADGLDLIATDSGSGVTRARLSSRSRSCFLEWERPEETRRVPIGATLTLDPPAERALLRVVVPSRFPARAELKIEDAAGNTDVVRGVISSFSPRSGRVFTQTFKRLTRGERYLTFRNSVQRAYKRLRVRVNGKTAIAKGIGRGQDLKLDLEPWMRPGSNNTVRISGEGEKRASALVTILSRPFAVSP